MIEKLIRAAPARTLPLFYRMGAGPEIDLIFEMPKHGLWAIQIKRGDMARPEKGFFIACDDFEISTPFRRQRRQRALQIRDGIEVMGVLQLTRELAALSDTNVRKAP